MEKTELMKKYEETTYLDDDPQALMQIIEYLKDCIQEYKTKAEELIKERAKPTITYQAVETFQEIIRNQCDEITALKEKANAYDRLMSGGKKTPKEVANFLGKPIAMDRVGVWCEHESKPSIGEGYDEGMWVSGLTGNDYVRSISMEIDFNGNWDDSLTLPDGWEGK